MSCFYIVENRDTRWSGGPIELDRFVASSVQTTRSELAEESDEDAERDT